MRLILVTVILLQPTFALGQNEWASNTKRNSLYAEFGGSNWGVGIGYDRLLTKDLSFTAEAGYYYFGYGVSTLLNYLTSQAPHKVEVGAGLVFRPHPSSKSGTSPAMVIGYRFQKKNGGFFFRAHYVPIWYWDEPASSTKKRLYMQSWGGLSIGRTY